MSQVTLEIPESMKSRIEEIVAREGSSLQDFLLQAANQQLIGIQSLERLKREASNAKRADFDKFLAAVPSAPPLPGDELP